MKKSLLVALCLLITGATAAAAGSLSPGLQKQLSSLKDTDVVKVLVVMSEQADIPALDAELHASKAPLGLRHQRVVADLQETAARSQNGLLAELASRKGAGGVLGFTPHWLINAIVVRADVQTVRQLAERSDVERIEADLRISLIEPVGRTPGKSAEKGIGITQGLQAIQADRVWRELGVTGEGAIVGNMDTGVDGTHPALSARWRGNFAPTAECWLDIAEQGFATPQDAHYHGTHVMGTITGLAPDDTIGVAPGALWIASNAIYEDTGSEFDNDVIASLEWFADPDGDPGTSAEVPDVIQNSWGVNESFSGYYDCDSRWWTAIDNCEAAGVCLTWSAGNEGSGSGTLRSPADRAESPTNCFSVGSTQRYAPYEISDFSSRGPSGCGGPYAVKPEVVAPGSEIYSAQPGGGYQYLDGTSMAGPHVAGVVALMRSANPNVDVTTIKEILMETATDLGAAGEDNTYGHGLVNAYEAVLAVMGGIGHVAGTVTDAATSLALAGASVHDVGGYATRTTDDLGGYDIVLTAEPHTLEFSAFGYESITLPVSVIENDTVTLDAALVPLPTATISGTVYDPDDLPVGGATVVALNTPLEPATTDGSGHYTLTVPDGATYQLRARAAGLGADQQTVVVAGHTEQDFHLPILTYEDFETADFYLFPWQQGGDQGWIIDSSDPYEGLYCARSGDISDNQESTLSLQVEVTAESDLSFYWKVSSETNYDYLRFLIDGAEQASWSGTQGWTQATYTVGTGQHTFTWKFTKDGSVSSGSDCGYVDLIQFPTIVPPTYPSCALAPEQMEVHVSPYEQRVEQLNLTNTGGADLHYTIVPVEPGKVQSGSDQLTVPAQLAAPGPELAKGDVDPRPGRAAEKGQGGPDDFGYRWIDSDDPAGPNYTWKDISSIGTVVGSGDDSNHGPFPLGFSFFYYGGFFDEVRVCTNGWVSFTSSATDYTNDPIPTSDEPNNLLAPFWDDLNPNNGGTIYYYQGDGEFIVQWDAVPHYSSGGPETFQVVLRDDGTILYQYETVDTGNSCTVGIEDGTGTDGLEVAYNASYLHAGLAILFTYEPPLPWLEIAPLAGTVSPGGTAVVQLTFSAGDLEGYHGGTLLISTNDPEHLQMTFPVGMYVDGLSAGPVLDLPAAATLGAAAPNPFNPTTVIPFALPRAGQVDLCIYDVAGRLVRTLVSGKRDAGHHEATWNGCDDSGRSVASGSYYVRLRTEGEQQVRPLVLVR
jgi:subtilisin family serine protease